MENNTVPIIMTDSCADLPDAYYEEMNVPRLSVSYIHDDQEDFDLSIDSITDEFYDMIASGVRCTTSQISEQRYYKKFQELAQDNKPIIYISLSSALSASYRSACLAAERLMQEDSNADITVIDSKGASMGQGLFVLHVVRQRDAGKNKEEILQYIEDNILKVNYWFTVDDLTYLKNGGRLSAPAAFFGNILSINPLMWVDDIGRLIPVSKERGRKRVLKTLVNMIEKRIENPAEQTISIAHGKCEEDALLLQQMIEERIQVKNIMINRIGPVIGSHCGPSVLALFFMGKKREGQKP